MSGHSAAGHYYTSRGREPGDSICREPQHRLYPYQDGGRQRDCRPEQRDGGPGYSQISRVTGSRTEAPAAPKDIAAHRIALAGIRRPNPLNEVLN